MISFDELDKRNVIMSLNNEGPIKRLGFTKDHLITGVKSLLGLSPEAGLVDRVSLLTQE